MSRDTEEEMAHNMMLRVVVAVESIAKSLEKMANPLVTVATAPEFPKRLALYLSRVPELYVPVIKVIHVYTGCTLTHAQELVDEVRNYRACINLAKNWPADQRNREYLDRFQHSLEAEGAMCEVLEVAL